MPDSPDIQAENLREGEYDYLVGRKWMAEVTYKGEYKGTMEVFWDNCLACGEIMYMYRTLEEFESFSIQNTHKCLPDKVMRRDMMMARGR